MCRHNRYVWLAVVGFLSACDGNTRLRDLQQYVDSLQKKTITMVDKNAVSGVQIPIAATYRADGLRAPFEMAPRIPTGKESVFSNSLQSYPLTALRFVGTVAKKDITYAFILTPDNMIYQVKQGDIIGDHYGKITGISSDRLSVTEQVFENDKPVSQHVTTLQLRDEH